MARLKERTAPEVLWARYRAGAPRALDDLIRCYRNLVTDVVDGGNYPRHIGSAELAAAGDEGLWKAITGWNPELGPFEARAKFLIHKHIQTALRGSDHLTRAERAQIRSLQRAEEQLTHSLHRPPLDAELAGVMRCTEAEILDIRGLAMVAADNTIVDVYWLSETQEPLTEADDPAGATMVREFSSAMREALNGIGGRHGIVLRLYYLERMSMPAIGEAIGVKGPMVSRLHTQAISQLRQLLA